MYCRVLGWISFSVQTIAISPMLIAKYIHAVAIYIRIDEYIFAVFTHSSCLNNIRLETSAVYRIFLTQLHIVIISLRSPIREFTPGVLSSLEQTAWPRGEPGSSSDCMDGSVRFLQAEHRALFTAVCPFLTLAPFFMLTDFLWRETDRLDWHLKASFRLSYGLLKPCCKMY